MARVLSELRSPEGATREKRRVGRGPGSGLGKTAGRGQKGQYARSRGFKPHFEGGQTPLQRRLPKRGFTPVVMRRVAHVNIKDLQRLPAGAVVDEARLRAEGLVKGAVDAIKILGDGELGASLAVHADAFSKGAAAKIVAAGGTVVIRGRR